MIHLNIQVDCEATQHSMQNPALGERAIRGLGEILNTTGTKATFMVIPSDMRAHAAIYRELEQAGHEIGLHTHPADQGYGEFLGIYGFDDQARIVREGMDALTQELGHPIEAFTPGYCSANDYTFPALESVGMRHGTVSMPTRNLPQCASIWSGAPLDVHYPHRYNRCLAGNVDFVEVPVTVDPESRMWGGAHPQDLRVELVDAKNHWYTINKNVQRQTASGVKNPVKHLKIVTHNIFDYSDAANFRRETLLAMIDAVRRICETEKCELLPATTAEIAAQYRRVMPKPEGEVKLELDTRGRMK